MGATTTLDGNAVTQGTSTTWSYVLSAAAINGFGQGAETLTAVSTDAAGNSTTNTRNISVDTTAPTIVITDDEPGTANIAGGNVVYTFQFNETVTGFKRRRRDGGERAHEREGTFTAVDGDTATLAVADGGL